MYLLSNEGLQLKRKMPGPEAPVGEAGTALGGGGCVPRGGRPGHGEGGVCRWCAQGPCCAQYLDAGSNSLALSHKQRRPTITLRGFLTNYLVFTSPIEYLWVATGWNLRFGCWIMLWKCTVPRDPSTRGHGGSCSDLQGVRNFEITNLISPVIKRSSLLNRLGLFTGTHRRPYCTMTHILQLRTWICSLRVVTRRFCGI